MNAAKDFKHAFTSETVLKYRPFVTQIARTMALKLPAHVDFDELIQWGMLGLVDAIEKWDPNRKNRFKTYAEWRIRGAILDGLRSADIVSRSTRDRQKIIDRARRAVEHKKKRPAMPFEIADEIGIPIDEYLQLLRSAEGSMEMSIFHDDLFTPDDRKALLESRLQNSDNTTAKLIARQKLEQALKETHPVDRACFMLFYIWGLTMFEIGELFDCTESRISQRIKNVHTYNIVKGGADYGA